MSQSASTSHLLPVFARADVAFERGEGVWLYGTDGERYLDFTSGVAVNALGHCHPHLVAVLQQQATRLWHMSNLFKSPDGEKLAYSSYTDDFQTKVSTVNADGTSLATRRDGQQVRLKGGLVEAGKKAWVEGEQIIGEAPNLPGGTQYV